MRLEVLISTINQKDYSLLEKMNIQTDAIVINQCDKNEFKSLYIKGKNIKFISLAERGVGLSRNTALMRATADICLFADDDCIYEDDYEKVILNAFYQKPDADIIFFNVKSANPIRPIYQTKKDGRIRWYNCLKYGTVRIAVKRKVIMKKRIFFSLLFGGGTIYGSGEDSLFIIDCLKNGLKIYAVPSCIGIVEQKESSWFQGYNEKYFFDKGALFTAISNNWYFFLCLQFLLRHNQLYKNNMTFLKTINLMLKGAESLRKDYF